MFLKTNYSRMKIVLRLLAAVFLLSVIACKQKKSYNLLFNESFQENVEACAAEMMRRGTDSSLAVQKCACMIRAAFEIDSTMIMMKGKQLSDFLKANIAKMEEMCDSLPVQTGITWQ
jgi:hypothetical protein